MTFYEEVLRQVNIINEDVSFLDHLVLPFFYFYVNDRINIKVEYKEKLDELSKRYESSKRDIEIILQFFILEKKIDSKYKDEYIKLAIHNIKNKKIFFSDLKNQKNILEKDTLWNYISSKISNNRENELNKVKFILKLEK